MFRKGAKNNQAEYTVNKQTVNKQLAKETRLVVLLVGVVGAGVLLFIPGFSLIGIVITVIAILIVKIYQRPVRQRIESQMRTEAISQVPNAPSTSKTGDLAERLKKLASLRDDGLISAEDYELKKTHLLEEL